MAGGYIIIGESLSDLFIRFYGSGSNMETYNNVPKAVAEFNDVVKSKKVPVFNVTVDNYSAVVVGACITVPDPNLVCTIGTIGYGVTASGDSITITRLT